MVWAYVSGGSGDETTLRGNREAFDRWRFLPRVLRGMQSASTATSVLGQEIVLPVIVGPSGRHGLCHIEGEKATARGARAAGTIYTMSTAASFAFEEIAAEAGPWWFQLYIFRDREFTRELVARAAAAGASALAVTIDVPARGRREAEKRQRFAAPAAITSSLPATGQTPAPNTASAISSEITESFEPAMTWRDLDWLASLTSLPILLKGILHADDAARAVEWGARGIIVSNHGGRQLDSSISSLDALPAVAAAVSGRAEVLLDGGVRRGTDVLKALALGARAVMVARPIHYGLAVAGETGVRHVLELLQDEIARDIMLLGAGSPGDVQRPMIVEAGSRLTQ
jgi:4-hydroxymandelate oxidase